TAIGVLAVYIDFLVFLSHLISFVFFVVFFFFFFFFFQAEDGIRDDLVTGVQTCALPISIVPTAVPGLVRCVSFDSRVGCDVPTAAPITLLPLVVIFASPKSRILALPRLVMKMLAGLMSR